MSSHLAKFCAGWWKMCRRHHKTYACHMAEAGSSRSHQHLVHLRVGKRSNADHTQLAACFLGVDTFRASTRATRLIRRAHSQLDLVRLRKVISLMPIEGHFFYSNKLTGGLLSRLFNSRQLFRFHSRLCFGDKEFTSWVTCCHDSNSQVYAF